MKSPINKSLEETVAAHCPTAIADIVISSVRIHNIDRSPCCVVNEAISEGTHGRDLLPSRMPDKVQLCNRVTMAEKASSGVLSS